MVRSVYTTHVNNIILSVRIYSLCVFVCIPRSRGGKDADEISIMSGSEYIFLILPCLVLYNM